MGLMEGTSELLSGSLNLRLCSPLTNNYIETFLRFSTTSFPLCKIIRVFALLHLNIVKVNLGKEHF